MARWRSRWEACRRARSATLSSASRRSGPPIRLRTARARQTSPSCARGKRMRGSEEGGEKAEMIRQGERERARARERERER
eukprot:438958-Rhodomonas_salina.1